jgi:bacteriocin-like protein
MSKTHRSQTEAVHVREAEELSETELESVVGGALSAYSIQREPAETRRPTTGGVVVLSSSFPGGGS